MQVLADWLGEKISADDISLRAAWAISLSMDRQPDAFFFARGGRA